jgi:hypothetical protein
MYQHGMIPVLKPASINERRGSWQPVVTAVRLRGSNLHRLKGIFAKFSTGIHSLPQGDFCYGLPITSVSKVRQVR